MVTDPGTSLPRKKASNDTPKLSGWGLLAIRTAAAEVFNCPLPFTPACKEAPKGEIAENCTFVVIAGIFSQQWPGTFYNPRLEASEDKSKLIEFIRVSTGQTREAIINALHHPEVTEAYSPYDECKGPARTFADIIKDKAFARLALEG